MRVNTTLISLALLITLSGSTTSLDDTPEVFFNRGMILLRQGLFIKAVAQFDKAINLNHTFGKAYYQRAVAKIRLEQAITHQPSDAVIDLILAQKFGYNEALPMLLEESHRKCYNTEKAFFLPDQAYCVDFSSSVLKRLPEKYNDLEFLVYLKLFNNRFEDFPTQICDNQYLVSLDFSSNYLKSLPSCISSIPWLMELNLSKNKLTYLPDEITSLKHLKTLNLSTNHLTRLPTRLHYLKNLEEIDLSYNDLAKLPEGIVQMTWLKRINLVGNKLDKKDIKSLKKSLKSTEIYTSSD